MTPETFLETRAVMRGLVESAGGDFDRIGVCYTLPTVLTAERELDFAAMLAPMTVGFLTWN